VKDKKLFVNEVEAHIVREAFTLFLQHRQMAIVARLLTERGLLPRGSSWASPEKVDRGKHHESDTLEPYQ